MIGRATQQNSPPMDSLSEDSPQPGARIAPFPSKAAPHRDPDMSSEPRGAHPVAIRWIAIAVLIAAIGAVAAWYWMRDPMSAAPVAVVTAPLELASVDVAAVERRVLSRSLPLSGSLAPVVQATVKSKVGGEIQEVTVREGEDVREGDVIARIDTRNLQAQYDRELAAVEKASADRDLATLNRDKNRTLLSEKYISQNTFESTESAYAASIANLKLAEAQARLAKISLDDAVIRAPFAGTVARRLVQPGEKVSSDAQIVALVDLRQMLLEAAVPAAEVPGISIGQTARFRVGGFSGREFEGKVQRINPMTSEGSRAITLYIAVPNPDRALKGGMFAQGQLIIESGEPVLAIPRSAVREESGVPVVYTFENGSISRKQISVGPPVEGNTHIEVRTGLQAGEQVIVVDIGERKAGSAAVLKKEAVSG